MANAKKNGREEQRSPSVKLPGGVTMQKLSAGLRPEGFLVVPTDEEPKPTTFLGVLMGMGQKPAKRPGDKDMAWGVFRAIGDQGKSFAFDKETSETTAITDGMLVGVSKKGALHGMSEKQIGHLFAFEYTGKKKKLGGKDDKRSPMWEVLCEVSEAPYNG